jgi:hypothetical protein
VSELILIPRGYLERLDQHAATTSKDIESLPGFDDLQKMQVQLLFSTLYGYITSAPYVVEQGEKLAQVQEDKMANYKQLLEAELHRQDYGGADIAITLNRKEADDGTTPTIDTERTSDHARKVREASRPAPPEHSG